MLYASYREYGTSWTTKTVSVKNAIPNNMLGRKLKVCKLEWNILIRIGFARSQPVLRWARVTLLQCEPLRHARFIKTFTSGVAINIYKCTKLRNETHTYIPPSVSNRQPSSNRSSIGLPPLSILYQFNYLENCLFYYIKLFACFKSIKWSRSVYPRLDKRPSLCR